MSYVTRVQRKSTIENGITRMLPIKECLNNIYPHILKGKAHLQTKLQRMKKSKVVERRMRRIMKMLRGFQKENAGVKSN